MDRRVTILGRFPPPIDGQALATRRLATLLEAERAVERIDLAANRGRFAQSEVRFRPEKLLRYVRGMGERRRALRSVSTDPHASPIIWTSISPSLLGHWRDLLTVVPLIPSDRPLYAVVHWGSFDRLFRRMGGHWSGGLLTDRVDRFVFLSERLAGRCAEWIPETKRAIIPNTIDETAVCSSEDVETARKRRRTRPEIRLLFLSNMTRSKGYEDVLKAVDLARDEPVRWTADFVGRWESDEQRSAFLAAIAEHDLEDRVRCHGPVTDRSRIREFYLGADLFVLPTYYPTEAFPLTILEALAAGTPVITTPHAGIPDMVRDGKEARFVPPRSPEAIVRAGRSFAENERWRRASRAARARFEEQFRPDRVRSRWIDLLDGNLSPV